MHSAENISMRYGSVFFLNYIFILSIRTYKYNLIGDYEKFLHKYRWRQCESCVAV